VSQTFVIAPADIRWLWVVAVIPVAVVVLTLLVLGLAYGGARGARFDVSPEGLRLRGDFYGRFIPSRQLRIEEARRVDLATRPELTPARRTMGTGLHGYQAGWFRLRNGEKALLYLTDRSRAVYVPTTDGYSVLLSPTDPDAFLAALGSIRR
jgi:hypothetical protein